MNILKETVDDREDARGEQKGSCTSLVNYCGFIIGLEI